ncbi:hypothetical protein FRACYDRAFT_246210 [Fragilariopsis cylindrus CCMP1102]|uniref:Uncharacterized protein n=1 Tax=Fragilariopsis cylindrus CCMP1102 TaxID=635003 RepID=A0A1E7EZ75_9STRA|nr:hypothetical protein FRACYDRAFT_246210 [Fragilariopsis cylindrus CCMP1102]|eukprot:OEU11105.1 hypothetical protein FRACYDRAFT_246210 [Fragilariopsis cylindrus CCMP1102]
MICSNLAIEICTAYKETIHTIVNIMHGDIHRGNIMLEQYHQSQNKCTKNASIRPNSSSVKAVLQRSRSDVGETNSIVKSIRKPLKSCLKKVNSDNQLLEKSHITFTKLVKVHYVPSLLNLSESHMRRLWFQEKDYDMIKLNVHHLIQNVRNDSTRKNDDSVRGLERYFEKDAIKKMQVIAMAAVLGEQAEQLRIGRSDPIKISEVCRLHTWRSIFDATKRGQFDETSKK